MAQDILFWGFEPWLKTHQLLNLNHGSNPPKMRSRAMAQHPSIIEFEPWLNPSFFYALSMAQTFWLCSQLSKANLSKTCLARSGYPNGPNVIFLGGLSHGSDIFLCVLRHDSKFIFLGVLSHGSESFLSHGSDPTPKMGPQAMVPTQLCTAHFNLKIITKSTKTFRKFPSTTLFCICF